MIQLNSNTVYQNEITNNYVPFFIRNIFDKYRDITERKNMSFTMNIVFEKDFYYYGYSFTEFDKKILSLFCHLLNDKKIFYQLNKKNANISNIPVCFKIDSFYLL